MKIIFHAPDRRIVHKLEGGRHDLRTDDLRDGDGRILHLPENNHQGLPGLGHGDDSQDDFRDDSQGPFRTHEQLGQVIAHHALHRPHAGLDDLTRRKNDLQSQDVILGHSIFDRPGTTGALRHISTQGAVLLAGRIRRIVEPQGFNPFLEFSCDDPGLHDGDQVLLVDLKDPVEPGQDKNNATLGGNRTSGEPGPQAPWNHGEKMLIGQLQNFRDLRCGPRKDDKIERSLQVGGIIAVADQIFLGREDVLLPADGLDLLDDLPIKARVLSVVWRSAVS